MGFGLLLIGYFLSFAMELSGNSYYLDIVGGMLMTYALLKLAEHSLAFKRSVVYSAIFTVASAATAAASLFFGDSVVFVFFSAVRAASILLLHIYVLLALENMARGADDLTLARRSRRNMNIVIGYFVFYVLCEFIEIFANAELSAYINAAMYFYRVLWLLMNLLLIHSAYARLYIEGTQEAYSEVPVAKESRFKLVNALRRRAIDSQKRAHEADMKLMREAKEYALANRDKYEAKKARKSKNKKKR